MVGHIPDALAEILFPLMKTWKIYSTETIISESNRAHHKESGYLAEALKSHVITNFLH